MIMAMMDDRENQNPNQLKKSQSMQADEIKKLANSKSTNETSKNTITTVTSNENKTLTKPPTNVDTNKIVNDNVKGKQICFKFKYI